MSLVEEIAKGLLGGIVASETGANQTAANRETLAQNQFNIDRGVNILEGDAVGRQPGGQDALKAKASLAGGDIQRAGDINRITKDFDFSLPLNEANELAQRDVSRKQGAFDKGLADIVSSRQRLGGGIQMPNSEFEGGTVDALARAANSFNTGVETQGLDIFNKQKTADLNTAAGELDLQSLQSPAPDFVNTSGQSAQIASKSPGTIVPSISPLQVAAQAGGGVIQSMQQAEQSRQDNANFLEALRHLGNQKAGVVS